MRPHAPWPQPAEEGSLRARVAFFVAVAGAAVSVGSLGVVVGLHFLGVPIPDRSPLQSWFMGSLFGGLSAVSVGGAIQGSFQTRRLRLEGLPAVLVSFGGSALFAIGVCAFVTGALRAVALALIVIALLSLLSGAALAILSSLRRARQRGDTATQRDLFILGVVSLGPLLLVSLGLWDSCGQR